MHYEDVSSCRLPAHAGSTNCKMECRSSSEFSMGDPVSAKR